MSDFATAVTAVEMAVKALSLEGQISITMDSEEQTIILDSVACLQFEPGKTVLSAIDEHDLMTILSTDDVTEAVIAAVAHVVSEQARSFLYSLFEAVEDDTDLDG